MENHVVRKEDIVAALLRLGLTADPESWFDEEYCTWYRACKANM